MVFHREDDLPPEAEDLFASELAESRKELPPERPDRDMWRFALVCAISYQGDLLGGLHLDVGPINYGPVANDLLAFVEAVFVREDYRRQGLGILLMSRAIQEAAAMGCSYLRCSADWNNAAEVALYRSCGFALVDVTDEEEYLAVKSLEPPARQPSGTT